MSCPLQEVLNRLVKALDSDYNVIDQRTVYDVISKLEGANNITREVLETTRMAKYVNELRRRTTDVELARRSKSLLKQWRQMVMPEKPAAVGTTTTNATVPTPSPIPRLSQNGSVVSPLKANKHEMHQQKQQSHGFFNHNSSKISPNTHPIVVPQRGHRGGSGTSSSSSSSYLMHHQQQQQQQYQQQQPMEIINLVDDRSNSPSMFMMSSATQRGIAPPAMSAVKRPRSVSPQSPHIRQPPGVSISANQRRLPTNVVAVSSSSVGAIGSGGSGSSSLSGIFPRAVETSTLLPTTITTMAAVSTCDNENFIDNDSNVSRKHKKHKKDKRSSSRQTHPQVAGIAAATVGPLNHVDERSAPSILLEDSLSSHHRHSHHTLTAAAVATNSHLILPEADSLSNTSASIFNSTSMPAASTTASVPLSFAGHFSRNTSTSIAVPQNPHVVVDPPPTKTEVVVKVAKKRGRKKGSKGIDSLLASQNESSIAAIWPQDTYQDLKQKITACSGPKKNKTTQELLAEIQSKKPSSGNVSAVTSPSVTQAPSPSSLSDKSHQSQSTEFGSISTRVSPEPSSLLATIKPKEESRQMTNLTAPAAIVSSSDTTAPVNEDIELVIKRLQAQLPPIYKTDAFDGNDYVDDDDDDETETALNVPRCTCSLREMQEDENDKISSTSPAAGGGEGASAQVPITSSIEINIVCDSDEEQQNRVASRQRLKSTKKRKKREKVAVKSIFDLEDDDMNFGSNDGAGVGDMDGSSDDEDDDDDDEFESVPEKEDVLRVLVANEFQSSQQREPKPPPPPLPMVDGEFIMEIPTFTKYEAVIDPDCPAMEYFETHRNDVTNFHIETLHARYIPGVNGTWSIADTESVIKTESNHGDDVSIDTANRVVPRYNFLVCEKIPKQFPPAGGDAVPMLYLSSEENNGKLPAFNELRLENVTGMRPGNSGEFREWYQTSQVQMSENENLTILPYVVID